MCFLCIPCHSLCEVTVPVGAWSMWACSLFFFIIIMWIFQAVRAARVLGDTENGQRTNSPRNPAREEEEDEEEEESMAVISLFYITDQLFKLWPNIAYISQENQWLK